MVTTLLFSLIFDLHLQGGGGRAVAAPPDVPARPEAAVELKVVLAAPVYQPNGGVVVETVTLPSAPSVAYVYARRSICETATAGAAEPSDAGFGWRLATNTVSRSSSEMVVSVDWRRMWDRGQKLANGPAGTVQLTLHAGDRIPLDHIPNVRVTDACRAVGMGLEVRLARGAPAAPSGPGNVVLPLGAVARGDKPLDAEIWLLHTPPPGTQEQQVQHQTVRLSPAGGTFGFTPVKFTTSAGEIGVELTGSIQRYQAPAAGEFLLLSMSRLITGGSAPPGGLAGATPGTLIALPNPADVLSFVFPGDAARGRSGGVMGMGGGGGGGGAGGAGVRGTGTAAASGGSIATIRQSGNAGGVATARQGPAASPEASAIARALTLLEGHVFSVRLRVSPGTEK